ncbi:Nucleotide-binding universal stress protein, UspA family [Mucilaginibacter mallensis]|uniref:Nucleotide-binding universal stress protein, UspA family n=1 Tax=Mucilaginibacter mallensis TaxID=652787 RepID=A0A1H1UG43_MUCMA|nr:universal stress protein [Mucilaginibacter mallensis]SDS71467.1 Nucleotide-binding universal stress protein, UspA family [Mucilaginibacter mallensis]
MKTVLVLTDFSINADYVAHYALGLTQTIRANLLLCNIYQSPDGEEVSDRKLWHMRVCEENSINDLGELVARLKSQLDKGDILNDFRPDISQYSEEGLVGEKLKELVARYEIVMAVISKHSANNITNIFGRNHAWNIIENAGFPVLVIPYQVRFKAFKMIAFATAMGETDINVLESLSVLAEHSGAEIMLTHVADENSDSKNEENKIKKFFDQVTCSRKSYHNIKGDNVINSLTWLAAHIDIDLLVLVHHKRGYFEKLLGRSITQKMANSSNKPLLIFPSAAVQETVAVF